MVTRIIHIDLRNEAAFEINDHKYPRQQDFIFFKPRQHPCKYCLQLFLTFGIMAGPGLMPNGVRSTFTVGRERCRSDMLVVTFSGR